MISEIICVGTELLTGDTVNTNASYVSKRLMELGAGPVWQSVVGDNRERLTEATGIPAGNIALLLYGDA